jgi:hypothetical protein
MTIRIITMLRVCALLILASLASVPIVEAHESSTSYLTLEVSPDGQTKGTLDIGVFDLSWSVLLDSDFDGRVLWREVTAARPDIDRLVADKLVVERGGVACTLPLTDVLVTRHVGEPYLSLELRGQCPSTGPLRIRSNLLFDEDSGHRTLLEVHTPSGASNGFLAEHARSWSEPAAAGGWTTFASFVREGIWHVWTGYDHLAFLLSLLLPCALVASGNRWRPADEVRPVIVDLLRVVTCFTIAHSITLGIATLHLVTVSARIIEPLIALTIVISALFNLIPAFAGLRLTLAFSFGLIHGFGFALALSELSQTTGRLVALLAGFNIGVELAQLSVVLLIAPAIVFLRHSRIYANRLMPAASVIVAMSGFGWLAVRL